MVHCKSTISGSQVYKSDICDLLFKVFSDNLIQFVISYTDERKLVLQHSVAQANKLVLQCKEQKKEHTLPENQPLVTLRNPV